MKDMFRTINIPRSNLHRAVLVKNRERAAAATGEGRRNRTRRDIGTERQFKRLEAVAGGRPGIEEAALGKENKVLPRATCITHIIFYYSWLLTEYIHNEYFLLKSIIIFVL